MPFHPPEAEAIYQQVVQEVASPFFIADEAVATAHIEAYMAKAEELQTAYPEMPSRDDPENPGYLSEAWAVPMMLGTHKDEFETDQARRLVLQDVLNGLRQYPDGGLSVSSVDVFPGLSLQEDGADFTIDGSSSIPNFVAFHAESEERGACFAATTAYLAARLLTPEVVEIVLADTTREVPTKYPSSRPKETLGAGAALLRDGDRLVYGDSDILRLIGHEGNEA